MSEFSRARAVEMVVWSMRLSEWPRSQNRSLIDSLANGAPPVPPDTATENGTEVNVNDLSLTRLAHDARMQLYQAFNKPGNFFTCKTDLGSQDRRTDRGMVMTKEANRVLKRSDSYYQTQLSKFAQLVLHGIGPSIWQRPDDITPTPVEIADVMIPSRTLLTFDNLPFFAIWRGYTARELRRLTRHPETNPGWNMPVVKRALGWCDEQTSKLFSGTTWAEYWVPEKMQERFKEDAGVYASDITPTIDCWDFYYWDDAKRHEGWRRRIVFDAQGGQAGWLGAESWGARKSMPDRNLLGDGKDSHFLFSSGDRVVADDLSQILHFQFADLSARAPFRYHSVRSLGFLLYAVCHLQNRLRCAFSEAVFENLMMYMRVKSLDEAERALKIELVNRGIIDESVQFLPPGERWQPNPQFAELGLNEFKQIISDNSASYVQNNNLSRDKVEKTKFQVMAEVTSMQTLISAALQQAYRYELSEYREDFRRLLKKDSLNPAALEFRARCMQRGIPEKLMTPGAWEIEPERVYGGGNKTLEMAIANQLMEWKSQYSPEAQQLILRKATLAVTDDAAEANSLVPYESTISQSKHDAMLAFGSLMAGGVVQFTKQHSTLETTQTLLVELALAVKQTKATGNMPSLDKFQGMQNVIRTISGLVAELSKDKTQAEVAKKLAQISGKLANEVKGFGQRLAQKMKAEQQQGENGEMAGKVLETKAKVAATIIGAKAKAAITAQSHAGRTAQRQAQWELEQDQKEASHRLDLQEKAEQHEQDLQQQAAQHALQLQADRERLEIEKERAASKPEPSGDDNG